MTYSNGDVYEGEWKDDKQHGHGKYTDSTFLFGTCENYIMYTLMLMETDTEDVLVDITKSVIPYGKGGSIEITWNPRTSEENASLPDEVCDADELLDKPWCYEVKIGKIRDLTIPVAVCYVSFEFNGMRYNSPPITSGHSTCTIDINYSEIITVEKCDKAFLEYLDTAELKFEIHVKPWGWLSSGVYEGEWKDGKKNGHGKYTLYDGTVVHDGMWENGEPVK